MAHQNKREHDSRYRALHREEIRRKDRVRNARARAERLRIAEEERIGWILVEKRCTRCTLFKELDDFPFGHGKKGRKDGRSYYCRDCHAQMQAIQRQERGDEIRARDNAQYAKRMAEKRRQEEEYRQEHPEEIAVQEAQAQELQRQKEELQRQKKYAQDKVYRETHPEKIKASKKTPHYIAKRNVRYAKKRESHLEYMRLYNAMHPEKQAAYRKAHPETKRAVEARRRAKKYAPDVAHDLSALQIREILQAVRFRCAYCGKKYPSRSLTIDHLTALSKNGPTTLHNVIVACRSCNAKKQTGPVLKPIQPFLLTIAPARQPKKSG